MSLFTSLVSAWDFEAGGNLGLDRFGTNSLTNNNAATQVTGKIGHAVHFDGSDVSNQSLSIASNASLVLHGMSWELCLWVNFTSLPGAGSFPGIAGKWGSGSEEYLLYYDGGASRIKLAATADGSTNVVCSTLGPSTGTWYFLDAYFDLPNTTLNLRLNDAPAAGVPSAALANTYAGTATFVVGATAFGAPHLNGSVDGMNLWTRLLTSAERTQLYSGGPGGGGLEYPFTTNRRRSSASFY